MDDTAMAGLACLDVYSITDDGIVVSMGNIQSSFHIGRWLVVQVDMNTDYSQTS